jgi:hypothetical protein
MGWDGHKPEIFDQVINFAKETEMYDVQITIMKPFPGTPIYDRLKEEKRLLGARLAELCILLPPLLLMAPFTLAATMHIFMQSILMARSSGVTKQEPVKSSPAVGLDGTIYFGSDDGYLYTLNGDGTLEWRHQLGGPIESLPVLSSDGMLYIGCGNYCLYAFVAYGADAGSSWSQFLHDAQHTGRAP